ncbi:mitochondrial biogenesis AIM24-domain-containing protein [Annulohypoxylon maeteangense]|uniref:mitochondrial biogenesis AIM24-domain-containing protein n=1 Tax=Annulohypoxylon maeteangense TaxID=1927788 RepID=UPI0020083884|nr:mitochondrial biogenesis AIM24-domain-containing protein [Annulohypoxylon maeteangense]KAI0886784.1 mitochondrial biogenesis AIM24-domain-containing protein [Annulohypoxylon maeteangense]
MRGVSLPTIRGRADQLARRTNYICRQCRAIQISSSPSTESPRLSGDIFGTSVGGFKDVTDARFEVLGSPYSLLKVTLSASQRLYTRRGTLVAVSGKAQNAQSTLSILSPFTRAATGVPFLYQRITSTTPLTALISTKSPTTTFTVLHLDGTTDWIVAQRSALLAWTGHTLGVTPRLQTRLPLAHWGSSELTGRGLAALSAPGHIYQLTLSEGEEFVAHPANVVAYTITKTPPLPFRFRSSGFVGFQVPSLAHLLPSTPFLDNMRKTETYKFLAKALFAARTAARRTVWGDRLFLQFRGPMTLLMSSRGVRVSDVLSSAEVNELADAPMGEVSKVVELKMKEGGEEGKGKVGEKAEAEVRVNVASVREDGKVRIEETGDLKGFEKK